MKILAFVDVHGSQRALQELAKKTKDVDLIVCAGDISQFELDLEKHLAKLSRFGKLTLILHGNHEAPNILQKACSRFENIVFFHKKLKLINDILFIGFGGGGFEKQSPEMARFFKKHEKSMKKAKKAIFITHAPPYKTKLDRINSSHNGNNTTRNMIIRYQPCYAICGHFHENWQKQDKLGSCKILNPGPSGAVLIV